MNTESIEEAVNNIEADIFESTGGVEYFNICLRTNGFIQIVEFCRIRLWDSEEDERAYLDENDENKREPIEDCLRRRLKEELAKLKTISV